MNDAAWESARRGAEWLKKHLRPDGSMEGGTDLRAYYKSAAAFLAHGQVREAERVFDYVERHYVLANGDLRGDGVPWFPMFRTYAHGWLGCAAVRHGRYELARRLMDFVTTTYDPASGGFFADAARTHCEVMTTSMAGMLALATGRLQYALAAATFLRRLYEAQPDLRRGLYTRWTTTLVTEFAAEDAAGHLVDAQKARQWYFQYGIAAAHLASVAAVTGDRQWLKLAQDYLCAADYLGEDRYQTPQSGKIGWGAAWAYALSSGPVERALAATVSQGLRALQNDDGSWLATGVYGGAAAAADDVTLDVTAEFVTLQSWMGLVPNE